MWSHSIVVPELWRRLCRKVRIRAARAPVIRTALERRWRDSIAILMYHGVTSEPLPTQHWTQISTTEFAAQMDCLSANRCCVLPLAEVLRRIDQKKPLPPRTVCLTFDDGFRNVMTSAFPIMSAHQMPSTVFLISDLVATDQPAWPDQLYNLLLNTSASSVRFAGKLLPLSTPSSRSLAHQQIVVKLKTIENTARIEQIVALEAQLGRFVVEKTSPMATLNWEEVLQLNRSGLVDFGSHTATHPILSRCSLEQQEEELRRSRDTLRLYLAEVNWLAFPNGTARDFTHATCQIARALGFQAALTTIFGCHRIDADRFSMRRIAVGADTSICEFENQILIPC
jgi:peptidoglycan/xylan/chitin deacetylase (PgdA/CDA1 family)